MQGHTEPHSPYALTGDAGGDWGDFGVPREGWSPPSPVYLSCLALTDRPQAGEEHVLVGGSLWGAWGPPHEVQS